MKISVTDNPPPWYLLAVICQFEKGTQVIGLRSVRNGSVAPPAFDTASVRHGWIFGLIIDGVCLSLRGVIRSRSNIFTQIFKMLGFEACRPCAVLSLDATNVSKGTSANAEFVWIFVKSKGIKWKDVKAHAAALKNIYTYLKDISLEDGPRIFFLHTFWAHSWKKLLRPSPPLRPCLAFHAVLVVTVFACGNYTL